MAPSANIIDCNPHLHGRTRLWPTKTRPPLRRIQFLVNLFRRASACLASKPRHIRVRINLSVSYAKSKYSHSYIPLVSDHLRPFAFARMNIPPVCCSIRVRRHGRWWSAEFGITSPGAVSRPFQRPVMSTVALACVNLHINEHAGY